MSVLDFVVKDNKGKDVSLSAYKGKVLLIVNTATKCGLTPQYEGLENLYERYKSKDFEILDFPCNQFGAQAPGTDEEIEKFCVTNYKTRFPRFHKIDVNGASADPLYKFLRENTDKKDIEWNFAKFLVDRNGKIVKRISARTPPADFEKDIASLL